MAAASRELELFLEAEQEAAAVTACGPGCAACCVVNVSVLVPEAVAIVWYLQQGAAVDCLEEFSACLSAFADRVRWMDDRERPRHRLPCPFLDSRGHCVIHPVRPLLCRSISSVDSTQCLQAVEAAGATVVMNLPQKILCNLVFSAIGSALQERGLDSRSLELTRMVSNLLRSPGLVDDFVSGRRVRFE